MFGLVADILFLEKMRSWLILGLHLTIHAIFIIDDFILLVLFVIFELVVKNYIFFELVFVVQKERMLDNVGKTHSLLAVYYEDSLEEILKFVDLFF